MPTIVTSGSFTVFEDEVYSGEPAFWWEDGFAEAVFRNFGTVNSFVSGNTTAYAFICWNAFGILDNIGTVHVSSPEGYAVGLDSPNWAPYIHNGGTWLAEGLVAFGMRTYGSSYTFPRTADLTNDGDWIVEGVVAAYGAYLNNGSYIVNNGSFIVSASDGEAFGIVMDRYGQVHNSGLIQVTGATSVGIALAETVNPDLPNLVNTGTITAQIAILGIRNGSLAPYFHILNTGTINGVIDLELVEDILDNRGTINGNVFMYSGDDLVDTTLGVINGVVYLEDGADEFLGGAEGQLVFGGIGDDSVAGGAGHDEFYGESSADHLDGGAGNDFLDGGSAPDSLFGGEGDDVLDGGTGADSIDGGAGFDMATYELATSAVVVSLALQGSAQDTGGAGTDTLNGIEDLAGSAHNDTLTGDGSGNYLFGLGGNDTINGGLGLDVAAYTVSSASVTWIRNPDGSWTVNAGVDGTDTLLDMEVLNFSDREVSIFDHPERTFSGDTTSDVLFRRADGIMASWDVTGTSIDGASFLPTAGAEWSALGTGDVSGDARADVIWQRSDGLVYAWIMNGATVSTAVGIAGVGNEWSYLGVGDFNGDLTDDLAWQRNDGLVSIWSMNGAAIDSANAVTGLSPEWEIAGVGDFNSDGRDDFLWRNASTGQSVVWHMNGSAIQSPGPTSQQASLDWAVVGVGDTNGDGRDDVILQRASDGMIQIWAMDGTNVMSATDVNAADPAQWTVRGIGDYNGDGRDDILWQNDSGLVYVWLMNGAAIQGAGALSGIGLDWSII